MSFNCYLLLTISSIVFIPLIACHPILIVISFDGFRHDYINSSLTPHLYKLANNGVRGHMKSLFVTKTYPNHQSIATGFYEDIHGIVNNYMFDPIYNTTFNVDTSPDIWWTEAPVLPIWTANQLFDSETRFSGSMQWPGAHVAYRNQSIKYIQEYNDTMTWNQRIDVIIGWMTKRVEKANCVFAYFDDPDTTAHEYGPFSQQVYQQVRRVDKTVGYLLHRLERWHLLSQTNIIILSDHGMAEISSERVINLNDFISPQLYDIYGSSPVWSIVPKPGSDQTVYQTLLNASKTKSFSVYKRHEIPKEFHYRNHRRILPLFISADEGWDIYQNMTYIPKGYPIWGNHGYNNSLPSMRPLFIASGPAFKSGYNHKKPFLNIDLYPLMAYILQLFPLSQNPSDGVIKDVFDLLIPPLYSPDYDESTQKWFNLIVYVFCGFGILFFGSICLICGTNIGKSMRKQRPPDIVWDSLGSGLNIDLSSHLSPNVNDFSKSFDDNFITNAKRLQRREETLLLLQDDDEEDL